MTDQPDRLIRRAEARHLLGDISKLTLERRIKDGTMPPETVLSRFVRGWPQSVLEAFIREAGVKSIGTGVKR